MEKNSNYRLRFYVFLGLGIFALATRFLRILLYIDIFKDLKADFILNLQLPIKLLILSIGIAIILYLGKGFFQYIKIIKGRSGSHS